MQQQQIQHINGKVDIRLKNGKTVQRVVRYSRQTNLHYMLWHGVRVWVRKHEGKGWCEA